jgi:multiple sugar transport system substrate-binding protein
MRALVATWGPLLGAVLLLALSPGCGGEGTSAGPVTIHVAVWKANNPQAWEEALGRFHAAHPGIRAQLDIGPNSSNQLHDLITQKLRTRDASLDAFLMDVVWPPEFAAAGWALPLDEDFPPAERAAFFPGCIQAVTYDGHVYGIPFNTDGGLLYYRSDLLAAYDLAPPRTWPEMVAQIDRIQAGEDDPRLNGYSGQFKQYEGLVCNMLEFVRSGGGELLRPAQPPALAAVRFVRDRIIGRVAPRGVLTYEEQESLDLFRSGGAIFLRTWPYAWPILQDSLQSDVAGRVGIAPLPAFPGGQSVAALGGWSFGIHRASRHPREALAFVRFMTGPEIQQLFAVQAGKAPARRALYQDRAVLDANPHFADLVPVFEAAVPRPQTPIYPRISHMLQRYLHDAISRPDSPIESLAAQAESEMSRELQSFAAQGRGAR